MREKSFFVNSVTTKQADLCFLEARTEKRKSKEKEREREGMRVCMCVRERVGERVFVLMLVC